MAPSEGNNFVEAPMYAVVGTKVPPEAMKHLQGFVGERVVRRVITDDRVATAWIARDVMIGAESTNLTRAPDAQFFPGTVYWKTPDGDLGWIRLFGGPRMNAVASKETLSVQGTGSFVFRLAAPGLDAKSLQRDHWSISGLNVNVETDAMGADFKPGNGYLDVQYRDATKVTLHVAQTAK
jgi:hypothetical protein